MAFEQLDDKDPDSTGIDYVIHLAGLRNSIDGATGNYLPDGETVSTITSVTTSDPLLTVDSSTLGHTNSSITVKLSGGTEGCFANVTTRFTTTPSIISDDRTFTIYIKQR